MRDKRGKFAIPLASLSFCASSHEEHLFALGNSRENNYFSYNMVPKHSQLLHLVFKQRKRNLFQLWNKNTVCLKDIKKLYWLWYHAILKDFKGDADPKHFLH